MRKHLVLFVIVSLSFSVISPAKGAVSYGTWTLIDNPIADSTLTGTSPFVEKLSNGNDRVWSSDIGGPKIRDCDENGTCIPVQVNSPFGADVTIVNLNDGSRRAYFVYMASSGEREIQTAELGADGVSHGALTSTGLSATADQRAWGVPDAVVLPDGKVRIYYVTVDIQSSPCPEVIKSVTSTDTSGLKFVKDAGTRLSGGYVDAEVLRARTSDWLMITSRGPGCAPQRLFVFTSTDGLTWASQGSAITGTDANRLDPSGYEFSQNKFRIYYSYATMGNALTGPFAIHRATLSWKAPATKPKITITCVKGQTKKKVVGVNPKCPSGYKKI